MADAQSHATTILNKVLIPVLTTVLGATAIYFLGFNKKSGRSDMEALLVTKEATVKAWKSYVTVENIYSKNSYSILKDLPNIGLDEFLKQNNRESEKFITSIQELLKTEDADKDFINSLQRRLDNEKDNEPRLKTYVDDIKGIMNANISKEERDKQLHEEDETWSRQSKGYTDRAITDIEDIAKTLSERYGQPFAMTDFIIYNFVKTGKWPGEKTTNDPVADDNPPQETRDEPVRRDPDPYAASVDTNNPRNTTASKRFIGSWSTDMGSSFELRENGDCTILSPDGVRSTGTWNVKDNQLYMYTRYNNRPTTLTFNLSAVKDNSFTIKLAVQPFNTYHVTRN